MKKLNSLFQKILVEVQSCQRTGQTIQRPILDFFRTTLENFPLKFRVQEPSDKIISFRLQPPTSKDHLERRYSFLHPCDAKIDERMVKFFGGAINFNLFLFNFFLVVFSF